MKRIEVFISEGDADRRLGSLEYSELRGKEVSSFELDRDFVLHPSVGFLGPDIGLFRGKQYPVLSYGFGLFQDAAPDSWGRKIIRRREKRGNLRESDYLLGVFDLTRTGALRFKTEGSGVFVNADGENPAPPWTTLRTLENSSRRFDRAGARRIPFASAMTILGCEDRQEDGNGTYIDIAGFLMQHGAKPGTDLPELWRRMAFSLLVSNTDDHLRNHGFIAENGKWRLSPAYDLNANVKRPKSLSLELDGGVPIESIDTIVEASGYFRLGREEANAQLERIRRAVAKWREVAVRLGISRREQEEMSECFTRG